MAENNVGLRSVQYSNTSNLKSKEGRVATQRATQVATALNPAAARVQTYAGTPATQQGNRSDSLIRALGQLSPALSGMADTFQAKTDREVVDQAEYHIERIKKEYGTGIVNDVQVGKLLPEASAMVTAKITQAMGQKYGKELFAPYLEEISNDDNLRLNSKARNEYLARLREEARGSTDDPFYLNGLMTGLDAQINQHEQQWLAETAKYHKDVVRDLHRDEVLSLLETGGDLSEWDDSAKQVSPLLNRERNQIVVETAAELAVTTGDPTVLSRVPERFLNAESKAVFADTNSKIISAKYSEWTHQRTRNEAAREDGIRSGKIDILSRLQSEGYVPPQDYIKSPELFAYATQLANSGGDLLPQTISVSNASAFKSNLFTASMTGDMSQLAAIGYQGDFSENSLRDFVLKTDMLNSGEKMSLIEKLPSLMEGVTLMRDPDVKVAIDDILSPALIALRGSQSTGLQSLLVGNSVEANVRKAYQTKVRQGFQNYFDTHEKWAIGIDKQDIIDKATQDSLDLMSTLTGINGFKALQGEEAPANAGVKTRASKAQKPAKDPILKKNADGIWVPVE